VAYRIVLRQDTAENWTENDPILLSGEFGFETDTNKLKLGNGRGKWTELSYFQPGPTGATGPTWSSAPATAGSTGSTGDLAYDSDYLYVAVGANTWKRTTLTSW
jgi:hypothetical protein